MSMHRSTTIADLRAALAPSRRAGRTIGLVPTMGALHEGHLSLVREASQHTDVVVVSIFVNPAQFGPGEDLDAYPRDLERDERLLAELGAAAPAVVFAPTTAEVYPRERLTTVHVDRLTTVLCGRSRPGHFDGVTTVVSKLFNMVQPDAAWFGRKDYQQLAVLRRMVADLDVPVVVHAAPTVREPDGVALSSRNRYLDAGDRAAARALSQGLRAAVLMAREGRAAGRQPESNVLRQAVVATLGQQSRVRLDYVEVLDPDTLEAAERPFGSGSDARHGEPDGRADHLSASAGAGGRSGTARRLLVAVAAHVGPARLIDNVVVGDLDDEHRLLAATSDEREHERGQDHPAGQA